MARFELLTGIKIPAVRIEGGFLSNNEESAKIHSSAYQQTLAAAIVRAVDVYKRSIIGRTLPQKTKPKAGDEYKGDVNKDLIKENQC